MLKILVPITPEGWDEKKQEFVDPEYKILHLEHSLESLTKWESKWHKPFFSQKELTIEETMDYIKCMTLTEDVSSEIYDKLTKSNVDKIFEYISDPMTATTITKNSFTKKNTETLTSELIYYYMISLNIPFECAKWHLNRLFTLIQVCGIKNQPPKKINKKELMKRNAALNAARRAKLNSKG